MAPAWVVRSGILSCCFGFQCGMQPSQLHCQDGQGPSAFTRPVPGIPHLDLSSWDPPSWKEAHEKAGTSNVPSTLIIASLDRSGLFTPSLCDAGDVAAPLL